MIHKKPEFEGVLLMDKPAMVTSHDVVDVVRRALHMKQVGHAGTLDPLATGLLVMLVGGATKLSQHLIGLDKVYAGTMKLGEATDTYDADGTILQTRPVPETCVEELNTIFGSFLGTYAQLPPMFSAKKINGTPLYKMARKGQVVERETREIFIKKFDLIDLATPYVQFQLDCSKGTYVRSLVHEIGERLGCGAHLSQLRRLKSGFFDVKDAITVDQLQNMTPADVKQKLIPIQAVLSDFHDQHGR
jgi:tRNA pseudouridine55 synthase